MCKMASFVLTKDNIYFSHRSDSHEDIISEHGLSRECIADIPQIVRVEIAPPNDDYKLALDKWVYRVDQDLLPAWYDAEECEARTRNELREWYRCCVVAENEELKEMKGNDFRKIVFGMVGVLRGNSTVGVLRGNSKVGELRENSKVGVLRENSKVGVLWENSKVGELRDESTVTIKSKKSTVDKIKDNGVVIDRTGDRPVMRLADEN